MISLAVVFPISLVMASRSGGYAELFGIKRDVPLGDAMRMYQINELFEQFIFPVTSLYLFLCKEPLHLVVRIQKEYLEQVLGDGLLKTVGGIFVNCITGFNKSRYGTQGFFFRMSIAGILLQKVDKRRVEAEAGSLEHLVRIGEIVYPEVLTRRCEGEDGVG